jgi:ADP-L-glycero-D-manno-heptose 6-epimerase
MSERIAITGAAGFIGSRLAHHLAGSGLELVLVDHPLSEAKKANLVGLEQFEFVPHEHFLEVVGESRFAAIYHLGACSRTTETDWDFLRQNNLEYTQAMWRAAIRMGCPLVYASSAATYGDGSLGFDDRTAPDRLVPLNLYGKSKNDFDIWALEEVAAGRAPRAWAGLKFFNVYGPGEAHKGSMSSVVWHGYRQVRETGTIRLFKATVPGVADGHQRRDFVHVDDCVQQMLWHANHAAASGVFNSGTGRARTFLDLAKAVFAALGHAPAIEFIDMPAALVGKYQDFTEADLTKLRSVGYQRPPTPLEDGVAQYVNWMRNANTSPG